MGMLFNPRTSRLKRRIGGFTLVELLVVIGIIALLFLSVHFSEAANSATPMGRRDMEALQASTSAVETALVAPLSGTMSGKEWPQVMGALGLSPQQARIVELILQGKADKEIAREMGVSFGTLRAHLSRAFDRTGVSGRMELAALVFARVAAISAPKERQQP